MSDAAIERLESREVLRCPVTREPLRFDAEAQALCSPGHRYPVHVEQGVPFADLRVASSADGNREHQRAVYESEDSRYLREGEGDEAAFMRAFIAERTRGRARAKDRLFARAFEGLRLSTASRALEIGCNDGRYLNWLSAEVGCRGVGVDLSRSAIERAARARPADRTEFHVADADALPLSSGSMDAIISFDVFEHLGHRTFVQVMHECARVLRAGGRMAVYVVSQRDRFTLHETLRAMTDGRVGVDSSEGHAFENFIAPDFFRSVAREAGLEVDGVEAYHGFWTLFVEEELKGRVPGALVRMLEWLDRPLTDREYGNGFLACCSKRG